MPHARTKTHPGEVLREEYMKPLKLSANALARALHVSPNRITAIIDERKPRAVTSDTTLRLARFFGTTPQFWLNLQTALRSFDGAGKSGRPDRGEGPAIPR